MIMKTICEKRCIIGEGPIWNETESKLYYTNGMGNEICILDVYTGELKVRSVKVGVAAFAFDKKNRIIVSRSDGVFILNDDDSVEALYDTLKYNILNANDMKVGPDGRLYVGTQSSRRLGISDKTDGKLYCIDKDGTVRILLDNLGLSNGLEWSVDEKKFYHTDSDTHIIKEYDFDVTAGEISHTGRQVMVYGVDGFTVDKKNKILASCWGKGYIAVVDAESMTATDRITVPANIPASCAFAGKEMELLVVVTSSYGANLTEDKNAGFTFAKEMDVCGRKPYVFGY